MLKLEYILYNYKYKKYIPVYFFITRRKITDLSRIHIV